MQRHLTRALAVAAALLAPLALATCGDTTAPANGLQVLVEDNFFQPATLTVSPGSAITWKWVGTVAHNVTFDDGAIQGSDTQSSGTITRTFNTNGTFNYHCTIHTGMTGTITVKSDTLGAY